MCTPETIIGGTLASGLLGAKGAIDSGNSQAAISNKNAENYDLMAVDAERRGADDMYKALVEGRKALGTQTAQLAANNVDLGSGSFLSFLSDTAGKSVYDSLLAKNNAEREAYGYYSQAANERTNAQYAKYNGRTKALSSLLTSGVSAGNTWYKYFGKNNGPVKLS